MFTANIFDTSHLKELLEAVVCSEQGDIHYLNGNIEWNGRTRPYILFREISSVFISWAYEAK